MCEVTGAESRLLTKLSAAWPIERRQDVTVLVAVSRGADSVALARALHALTKTQQPDGSARDASPGRMLLAPFNHRLRGAESDADEAFVRELARQLSWETIIGHAQTDLAARGSGEGLEGAARQARYGFL